MGNRLLRIISPGSVRTIGGVAMSLRAARAALGLSVSAMAEALLIDERSYQRMESGQKHVPPLVAAVVRLELLERGLFARLAEIIEDNA